MVQGEAFCMLGNLACFLSSADFFLIIFVNFYFFKIMTEKNVDSDIKHHNKQT